MKPQLKLSPILVCRIDLFNPKWNLRVCGNFEFESLFENTGLQFVWGWGALGFHLGFFYLGFPLTDDDDDMKSH